MAHDLTFLLATYEALSDKSSFYAQGLLGLISELDAELRARICRMIIEVSKFENWMPCELESELAELDQARIRDLEVLRDQFVGRSDRVHSVQQGYDE